MHADHYCSPGGGVASVNARVLRGAEPWGCEGDETGVLVLHGFTGSPQSVRPLAEALGASGRTVLLPRLPGHGTAVADLGRSRAAEWVAEAEMALRGLSERCSRAFVAGLSMGGTIALDLAARHPDAIAGVVTINASVLTRDPRARLAPLLGRLPLTVRAIGSDICDPSQSELCYDRVPTRAAAEFLRMQSAVRARLGLVRCPALIFTSRQDHVVEPENAAVIERSIASTDRELVWLERSYHVATLDYDRELIESRAAAWIAARAS